jgi:hypothetical protein
MAAFSDYLENKVLNHVFTNTAYTPATNLYVALFTSQPNDALTVGSEVTGNNYSRQPVSFTTSVSGTTSNTANVTFSASGGNWGTVGWFAVFDASSAGNMLAHGALTSSKVVNDGDTLQFATGDIDITLD